MSKSNSQPANVQQAIESLRREITQLSETDTSVQTKLLAMIEDLEKQLESPQSSGSEATHKVATLVEQFESDHPKITNALGDLLTTLSSMGV
ncbi:MAG: DUF4404 family protein [Cyanobacteria bacterium P01_D01_bin.105]